MTGNGSSTPLESDWSIGTQSAPAEQETKPSSSWGDAGLSLPSFIKESSQEVARISFCLHQFPSAEFAVQAPSALQSAEAELARAI